MYISDYPAPGLAWITGHLGTVTQHLVVLLQSTDPSRLTVAMETDSDPGQAGRSESGGESLWLGMQGIPSRNAGNSESKCRAFRVGMQGIPSRNAGNSE